MYIAYILNLKVDVQTCDIKLESWGYSDEKLVFQWADTGNEVAGGLNKTLSQHYYTVQYLSNNNNTYAGISDGKN